MDQMNQNNQLSQMNQTDEMNGLDRTDPHASSHEGTLTELKVPAPRDRRVYPRASARIGVKLRRCANTVFSAGRTLDVSMGGASVELMGPREVREGERIAMAFENLASPVTRAVRMIGAQVIRVGPMLDGFQHVAVRFDSPQMGLGGMRLCNLTDRSHMPPAPRAA